MIFHSLFYGVDKSYI